MANEELCKSLEEQLREKWKEQENQQGQNGGNSMEEEKGEEDVENGPLIE